MDEPRQADAVLPVTVGTALWGMALVVLLVLRPRLVDAGTDWWIWVAAIGLGLGLLGTAWVRHRRAAQQAAPAAATDEAARPD